MKPKFDLSKSYKVRSGFFKGDILRPVSIAKNGDIMCLNSSRWAPTDKPLAWKREELEEFKRKPQTENPKEKVILIFKNGSRIELTEKNDQNIWEGVTGMIIEQWLSMDEVKKLYPEVKIK